MIDQDTADLVRRAAAGDELAWHELFDGLEPWLHQVSSAYRLGDAEAADAVATVWLRFVENIGSLGHGNSVRGWFLMTLRGECLARADARGRGRLSPGFAGVNRPVNMSNADRWCIGR